MLARLSTSLRRPRGASAVEAIVALMLVALVVLGISRLFGDMIKQKFEQGDERIRTMEHAETDGGERGSGFAEAREDPAGSDGRSGSAGAGSGGGGNDAYVNSLRGSRDDALADGWGESDGEGSAEGAIIDRKKGYAVRRKSADGAAAGGGRFNGSQGNSDGDRTYYLPGEEPQKDVGFNPFIIIVVLLLIGALIFVMIKGNKG